MRTRQIDVERLGFLSQVLGLVSECRVELVGLVISLALTTALGRGWFPSLQQWDSVGIVMLISLIWMLVCVALYQILARTSR